jgi:hypothetical protein
VAGQSAAEADAALVVYPAAARAAVHTHSHAALLAAHGGATARDQLLLLDPVLGGVMRELGLGLWLGAGATLNLPERHGALLRDLREIGPTLLLAGEAQLAALEQAVSARYPSPGSWRRRWIERALSTHSPRTARERVDALLVTRPLRRQLGASRMRALWVLDAKDAENHGSLLSALGAPLKVLGQRERSRPERAPDLGRERAHLPRAEPLQGPSA